MPVDTSSSYSSPISDADPYATPNSSSSSPSSPSYYTSFTNANNLPPLPSHIDPSTLPSVLPILGPLTGYTTRTITSLIRHRLADVSSTINRPLTQPEEAAIAFHTAKNASIVSYGPTLGVAAGLWRTYSTRAEYRWPFYGKIISTGEDASQGFWDGERMRIRGTEILKGVDANVKAAALHTVRGTAYSILGWVAVGSFVAAYGATVAAVGELRDQRLRAVTEAMRAKVAKERREKTVDGAGARQQRGVPSGGFEGRGEGMGTARARTDDDDASPTGGMMDLDVDAEQGRLNGARDMGGILSDGQMRTAEKKARPSQSPAGNRAATFQMDTVERQPKNFGEDYDDASPTGGSGATAGGADGGSVWERIRQQSSSEPTANPSPSSGSSRKQRWRGVQREQQEASPTGEELFAFSGSEEERNDAKDEAQREFDEGIEQERRGGDFGGGGWRKG